MSIPRKKAIGAVDNILRQSKRRYSGDNLELIKLVLKFVKWKIKDIEGV